MWGAMAAHAGSPQPGYKPLLLESGPIDPFEFSGSKRETFDRVQVVQASGSARGILEELTGCGCDVLGYLPRDAYVVRVPAEGSLDGVSGIRWHGGYKDEWKLAGDLADLDSDKPNVLRVVAFSGCSLLDQRDELSEAGELLSVAVDSGGTAHVRVLVAAGQMDTALRALAAIEEVAWIAPRRKVVLNNDDAAWVIQGGDSVGPSMPLFEHGLTGLGEVIAVADSGLDTDACQFRYSAQASAQTLYNNTQPPAANVTNQDSKVIAYYLLSGATAYDDMSKLGHGTHVAGAAAGDDYAHLASFSGPGRDSHDGMAPGAQLVIQDTGRRDGNQVGLPDSLVDLYVQGYDSGARIHNNSYGKTDPDTSYSADSRDVDEAAWRFQDLVIVFSTGNLGPSGSTLDGLGSTSKNPVVVGGSLAGVSNRGYGVCHFSSQGPTADGRLRPDLVAPGAIRSALEPEWIPQGGTDIYGNPTADSTTDPPNDNCSADSSFRVGTSFSAPLVAGAAALVREYFLEGYWPGGVRNPADGFEPSAALVKAVLINSAESIGPAPNSVPGSLYDVFENQKLADLEAAPNNIEGWGLLRMDRTLYFTGDGEKFAVLNDTFSDGVDRGAATRPPLEEGHTHAFELENVRPAAPLRVTLVWTDPAGTAGSGRALVNDLDLEIENGLGAVYRGNVNMQDNRSAPVTNEPPDDLNPVEQVILETGTEQNHVIRVVARHVPGNGRNSPYPSTRQGYALIVVGDFERVCPEEGCPADPDGGHDAGHDGGHDAGYDAGQDAGDPGAADQGADSSSTDAGPDGEAGDDQPADGGSGSKLKGGCACQSSDAGSGPAWLLFTIIIVARLRRARA